MVRAECAPHRRAGANARCAAAQGDAEATLQRINTHKARAVQLSAVSRLALRFALACALAAWRAGAETPPALRQGVHATILLNREGEAVRSNAEARRSQRPLGLTLLLR